jgi:hypothetical protein
MEQNLDVKNDVVKIIFFGCWNKGCGNDSSQKKVFELVNKHHEIYKNDFQIIAGDNIYPEKKEIDGVKANKYHAKDIISGFKCLTMKPYAIMGNHDTKKCELYELEKSQNIIFPKMYYSLSVKSNNFESVFLFLDTNLLTHENICEKDETKEKMFEWLRDTLPKIETNVVFIVTHVPLITIKQKKGSILNLLLDDYNVILDELIKYSKIDFIFLSADTHNYQDINFEYKGKKFKQITSGTGGADLDSIDAEDYADKNGKVNDITYHVNYITVNHGFTSIVMKKDVTDFLFYGLPKATMMEGGGRSHAKYYEKYLKYKQKYLNLNQNSRLH